jgi:hypothetical protein
MNFGLIIVGDEILSGKRQDKHLPKVIELLSHAAWQLSLGALRRRRPAQDHRRRCAMPLPAATRCSAAAASAPRRTTTPANALRPRWACRWRCTRGQGLIEERMRDTRAEQGVPSSPTAPTTCTA